MKIVTLGRKAIVESNVAKNLIAHWAGALNIDAGRVPRQEDYFEKCASVVGLASNQAGNVYSSWKSERANSWNKLGCWPANFVLIHRPSCLFQDEGWVCIPGCPCRVLGDKSRFFKQCAGADDLISYLVAFLSPPNEWVPVVPEDSSWDPEPGCPGLVVPWEVDLVSLKRWLPLLRPGAHLAILSSDGIEVGCNLEDAGFEIRDAILIGEESEGMHYCAKAARRERNAGVSRNDAKVRVVRYFPTDDIDTECPAEGFPEEEVPPDLVEFFVPREILIARRHSNHHATVKPLELMSDIMVGIPLGSLVVDPFLGSGSTAIAALNRRLSCIGIEQDTEEGYVRIALARVEYWCPAHVMVRCDWKPPELSEPELWR